MKSVLRSKQCTSRMFSFRVPENASKIPTSSITMATSKNLGRDDFKNQDLKEPSVSHSRSVQAAVAATPLPSSLPASSVTSWISNLVAKTSVKDLSDTTLYRSKRMLLDTLGVGILGYHSKITQSVLKTYQTLEWPASDMRGLGATVWGSQKLKTNAATAAFVNGVSVHSMDFDDTWHPPTHPSGAALPAVLALAETMSGDMRPTLEDILVAYNVGVQVQGLLLHSAMSARDIPSKFHPPAVVGVMGSAAACASLLRFGPSKCRNTLGVAASFAGAPMANAGTTTKPLHAGKAARFGLEAALLADQGLEGNQHILDLPSGFGAFYEDFDPDALFREHGNNAEFLLHHQDIALKRFPAHLGMHWAIDATLAAREQLVQDRPEPFHPDMVRQVLIRAPKSKYINRPLPATADEARHSFQFNACTALLDGEVTPSSYNFSHRRRSPLLTLLQKTNIETPADNIASFSEMYIEIVLRLKDGSEITQRCDTPYCHWRNPLTDEDVRKKFRSNAINMSNSQKNDVIRTVQMADPTLPASTLTDLVHVRV